MPLQLPAVIIDVFAIQRLKELKQREFYRALACRRQRRRREERREERALRSLQKNEARQSGEWWVVLFSNYSLLKRKEEKMKTKNFVVPSFPSRLCFFNLSLLFTLLQLLSHVACCHV